MTTLTHTRWQQAAWPIGGIFVLLSLGGAAWLTADRWWPAAAEAEKKPAAPIVDGTMPARLTAQARSNLGLVAQPVKPTTYWRKIEVPGIVTDRPGVSDIGVIAPVTGVVTRIYSHPGETVEPSAPLVSLRLTSESLHTSQRELFKATREMEIAGEQRQRLEQLAKEGAVAKNRLLDIDNQTQRAEVNVEAYRQDLLARGLSQEQLAAVAKGEFVTEITVQAPGSQVLEPPETPLVASQSDEETTPLPFKFEFEDLEVSLGQQAEAGQVLCHLADHRTLLIEGRGFKEDMPLIQQAAKDGMGIELEFEESKRGNWPPAPKELRIHHLENSIDADTRTFGFHLVLENQWQLYSQGRHTGLLWRFRPGDRLRLKVAVEKLDNVFVLPQAAVVREGPEAYVFRQNGDLFDRRPVHVVAEDRTSVVIANDGSLKPGSYIAQNAAASLNRVLKAQMASGQPTNIHVHADGTVHAAH
jgi:cobalt-zinc-cadmium efflux system membrane fusion protein